MTCSNKGNPRKMHQVQKTNITKTRARDGRTTKSTIDTV